MRIRLLSDLHLEFSSFKFYPVDCDLIILAGDIKEGGAFQWARETFGKDQSILYVPGNHEFYNQGDYYECNMRMHIQAAQYNILFDTSFSRCLFKQDNVHFLAGTLWTDYRLFSPKWEQWIAMSEVQRALNDYNCIEINRRKIEPKDFLKEHLECLENISAYSKKLQVEAPDDKIVIVSHHAPSIRSTLPRYLNDIVTAGFASNLENFILDHPNIKLWMHGHMHNSSSYEIGQCRVVANPKGYSRLVAYDGEKEVHRLENINFNPNLIVEI